MKFELRLSSNLGRREGISRDQRECEEGLFQGRGFHWFLVLQVFPSPGWFPVLEESQEREKAERRRETSWRLTGRHQTFRTEFLI